MKTTRILFVAALSFLVSFNAAKAVNDPPLFTCGLPVGTTIANTTGTHGIAGDFSTHTGNDIVYNVDGAHVLQCFCPDNSIDGVQSNWWKVDSLSESDKDFFVRRGWVLIPNGSLWGLDNSPYLVKNDSYSCGDQGGVAGASASQSGSQGSVLGASTFAGTGTEQAIVTFAVLSVLFGTAAFVIAKR